MIHSQYGIEKYLDVFKFPGFYLEIGAWDGEHFSQTAWLDREMKWEGVCVDPFPRNFEGRHCSLLELAISVDGKPREFVKVSIDRRDGGDVSYLSGFSDSLGVHRELIEKYCDHEIIKVQTITMEDLYREYDLPEYIEFLSVDTEGSELEIFQRIDFKKYRFGIITFEHNGDEERRKEIGEILSAAGYQLTESPPYDDVYLSHKIWLENEYQLWDSALAESSVRDFKENPMVIRMLGWIDPSLFADLVGMVPLLIAKIDSIGRVDRSVDYVSGTCLRMIYYAQKVIEMNPKSIVEIGAGVGQFYAILRALGYKGSYMILDRPAVQAFQDKYLAEVYKRTGLDLSMKPMSAYDLCLSFYALGEFDDDTKLWYIENVIPKCKHGLVLWNPHSGASKDIPFECTVMDEYPLTHPDCKQLMW